MTHEEARQTARALLPDYANRTLTKSKNGFFVCPFCGSGTGNNGTGAFSIDKTNEHWKCFACNKSGDVFALIGLLKGVGEDTPEAFTETYKELNIDTLAEYKPIKKEIRAEDTPTDYTTFFLQANKNIDNCDYLDNRGISKETQHRFNIGFIEQWKSPTAIKNGKNPPASARIIIPTSKESYIARATTEGEYSKLKEGKTHIFNLENGIEEEKPCFVVEGEIDALSLLEIGANAIGLGSTTKVKELLEYLKNNKPKKPLILCLDNDEPGTRATKELAEGLRASGIEFYTADILNGAKDPNEALIKDRESFISSVNKAINKPSEYGLTSAGHRIELFTESVKASAQTPPIKTGFYNLDNALDGGIIPALYVLGAISSLGKTTFVLQIADQIASNNNDVLIFSLEMSEFELMAKSISRLTYKHCNNKPQNAKTVRGLLNGAAYSKYTEEEIDLIEYAKGVYSRYAKNIYIKQGNISNTAVSDIEEAIKQHISFTGRTPIVIIDYLQIIKPYSERATDKQSTDYNISMLKNICRNYNTPIIGISSFNRDNYNSPVNMSAFKESGSLEYSADVLLALQPEGMVEGEDNKAKKSNIETVKKCKAAKERNIELVILKNRNGTTNKVLRYRYYAMFNSFEEAEYKKPVTEPKTKISI